MPGPLNGHRYGQTDIDPAAMKRRIGDRLRTLRIEAGMRQRDLAEAMSNAGHPWTYDTVSMVQTGQRRSLHLDELLTVARIFNMSVDEFLVGALGEPAVNGRAWPPLASEITRWVSDMPPFQGYEGQKEEIENLASMADVGRNEMCRQLWAVAIPAVRTWLLKRRGMTVPGRIIEE